MNHFKFRGVEVKTGLWSAEADRKGGISFFKGSGMAWFRVLLSAEQQRVVNEERESHPNRRIRQRMLVLWLLHCGLTREKAAAGAGPGRAPAEGVGGGF